LDKQITYLRQQNADDSTHRENYAAARNAAFMKATNSEPKLGRKDSGFLDAPPGYEGQESVSVDTGRL
jgi:hypothetical protein